MSKNAKTGKDWTKLWNEYTEALEKWRVSFQSVQKAGNEVQTKYQEVMEKALRESSENSMSQFLDNWKNAMNKSGLNAFKEFGENWQKSLNQPGMDHLKTYGDMMTAFAETWEKMWRK